MKKVSTIIGIDGNEANVALRVGISEYAFELLQQFSILHSPYTFQIYLKEKPRGELPKEDAHWHYKIVKPRKFWTQIGLPMSLYADASRPGIIFSPSHYAPRFSPIPTAISIMDLSYIHFPQLFAKKDLYQLTKWTAYSVANAKKIFTISEASKNDIINHYKVEAERIVVTYPGIKAKSNPMDKTPTLEELKQRYGIEGKFILFVGTIQPRKNIARLIEAFSQVLKKHEKISLVIVGKKGWLYEPILQKPHDLGISSKVKFLDFISNNDLHALYQYALCYILPSLYEGFGLPVLEAMQYGCPVITSNISSLPEAGGDAALYVNPEDVSDIANKIFMMVENQKVREEYRKKGYEHIKKFSWKKTAQQTLAVLEQMMNETL